MLFRPPYSVDAEPDTEDQVKPLELTQSMGYITIGNKIDTNDWNDDPAAHAAADRRSKCSTICRPASRTISAVRQHRSAARWRRQPRTNRARPAADHRRRSRPRIQFVPVYQLMGKTKADVMPPLAHQRISGRARLNWISFWLFGATITAITVIFFLGDILMTGRLVSIGVLAILRPPSLACVRHARQIAAYQPEGRGSHSRLQRREGHRTHHSGRARFRLSQPARDRHRRRLQGSHSGGRPPRLRRRRSRRQGPDSHQAQRRQSRGSQLWTRAHRRRGTLRRHRRRYHHRSRCHRCAWCRTSSIRKLQPWPATPKSATA